MPGPKMSEGVSGMPGQLTSTSVEQRAMMPVVYEGLGAGTNRGQRAP